MNDTERPHAPPPDAEEFDRLLAEVRAGDQPAAVRLHALVKEDLLRALRRRVGQLRDLRKDCDAEDLVQETWLDVFPKICQGQQFTFKQLFAYLHRTARSRLSDRLRWIHRARRDVRRETSFEGLPTTAKAHLASAEPEVGSALEQHEFWARWLNAESEQVQLVALLVLDGCNQDQVADLLGLDQQQIGEAFNRLRELGKDCPQLASALQE